MCSGLWLPPQTSVQLKSIFWFKTSELELEALLVGGLVARGMVPLVVLGGLLRVRWVWRPFAQPLKVAGFFSFPWRLAVKSVTRAVPCPRPGNPAKSLMWLTEWGWGGGRKERVMG